MEQKIIKLVKRLSSLNSNATLISEPFHHMFSARRSSICSGKKNVSIELEELLCCKYKHPPLFNSAKSFYL